LYHEQGYPQLLLQIIERYSQGPTDPDVSIRKAAAVDFKVGTEVVDSIWFFLVMLVRRRRRRAFLVVMS